MTFVSDKLIVAVGLIKRTVYVMLVYGAVSGLAVLTGLYYHVWFSTIIYNKLVEYKTNSLSISFITSITSVFIIIASTLAALNIVNYDFVYLAASLDISAFMICNSVLIRAFKNIKLENEDVMFDSNRASSICQNSRKSIQIEQKKSVVVERGNGILRSKTVQTKPNNSRASVILEISKISVKPENDT
ncbi:hypothetical protein HDV04_000374 [Boothiomyces sp. JEL0838]|nr:hypothetical protein HDV04_000374 [Boothiomyces sp. JEL0838]